MSSDNRVDRIIWWLTVSKAADISSRMRTDDLESAFAIHRASVTESSVVSVECPHLTPDWLASSRLCFDRNEDNWLKTTNLSPDDLIRTISRAQAPLQYRPRHGCSLSKWGSQRSGMLVYLSLVLFYKNNVKRTCIAQLLFKSLCLACSKRHF